MSKIVRALIVLTFGVMACKAVEESSGTSGSTSTDTELTLSTCTTTLGTSAPAFFKTYFKCATITSDSDSVTIKVDGLPPHRSYYYGSDSPNYEDFDSSRGSDYAPNPNTIEEQSITVDVPLSPVAKGITVIDSMVDGTVGTNTDEYDLGAVGVAIDSVPLFNPLAAPGDDIEDEKYTFDTYNAHPNQDGEYHYHTNTKGPLEVLQDIGLVTTTTLGSAEIELFGIMCDGTVVMGCTELDGSTPDDSDFDAQNGHLHDIIDDSGTTHFTNRYHTHICPDVFKDHKYTPEIQYYTTCVTS